MENSSRSETLGITRFVSTLAGAFKSFYIYNQDNKAFDDILENLVNRFKDTGQKTIKFHITNRSFLYQDHQVGQSDLTAHLSNAFQSVGFKDIIFQAPLQGRNFFQIFHILSNKDPLEVKKEKLLPFLWDGDPRPISLIPIASNTLALRLTDDIILRRLAPLAVPKSAGGSGFLEKFQEAGIQTLPDLLTWIRQFSPILAPATMEFLNNLLDALWEGYFPMERFVRLFPIPLSDKDFLKDIGDLAGRSRLPTPFQQTHRRRLAGNAKKIKWVSWLSSYSPAEIKELANLRQSSLMGSISEDLDLTQNLLKEDGPLFNLGLSLLLRLMNEKGTVGIQEKTLLIGSNVWVSHQSTAESSSLALLSSLRQQLCAPSNVNLLLFPLRGAALESDVFQNTTKFLVSLGRPVVATVIKNLDSENDRAMRKKLCTLLVRLGKENGTEPFLEALPDASFFFMRNIIMILGELKDPKTIPQLEPLLFHPQKIVRSETVRSLLKFGIPEAHKIVVAALPKIMDPDIKLMILEGLATQKKTEDIPQLIRFLKDENGSHQIRLAYLKTLGAIGGSEAVCFLESLIKDTSFLGSLSSDKREEAALVKTLLGKGGGA